MKKFKSYFLFSSYLFVLIIEILNLYNTCAGKSNFIVLKNIATIFIAIWCFVMGVKLINSNQSKVKGIILVSSSSIIIFTEVLIILFKLSYAI